MIIRNFKKNFLLFLMLLATSCVEPYTPSLLNKPIDILVIDGFLDSGKGTLAVHLSKATNLSDDSAPPAVTGAVVTLEDDDNNSISVPQISSGDYGVDGLSVDKSKQYRIRIKTGSKEYASDFVTVKDTPPIDSISYQVKNDALEWQVNTHDVTGDSRYYQWQYEETYEYHAYFGSSLVSENGAVRIRRADEDVYKCWRTLNSSKILIGTSYRLSDDIITRQPVQSIEKGSVKLSVLYSINVKQHVLSREAYDFQERLQKTTEQLGGLFDPLPGQVLGNIHCITTPTESVLGYFNAASVTEKRFFIKFNQLPDAVRQYYPTRCEMDTISVEAGNSLGNHSGSLIVAEIYKGPVLVGYGTASLSCSDCREQGGVTTRPSFWP